MGMSLKTIGMNYNMESKFMPMVLYIIYMLNNYVLEVISILCTRRFCGLLLLGLQDFWLLCIRIHKHLDQVS